MRHLLCSIAYGPLALALGGATPVLAGNVLPQGGSTVSGSATIGTPANNALTITQSSPSAVINWNSFSVGQPNTVTFNQPSSNSAILNRVTGNTPSTIAGTIRANGEVYLVNPNGIAITPSGTVNVGGGFVASTLGIGNSDFMAGKRTFTGNGSSAAVSNAGKVNVGRGGFVALLGGTVSNEGTIKVPLGKVGLGSGEQVTLDLAGDGFMQVAVPSAATTGNHKAMVDVAGKISAAGGSVELKAATVKQAIRDAVNVSGTLSARSVSGRSGAIVLGGGAGGNVTVAGRLNASAGQKTKATNGGAITLTGHNVAVANNASIKTASKDANGGAIRITGAAVSVSAATLDTSGAGGGGTILIGGGQQGTGPLAHAETVGISSGATLKADATESGNGGTIVVWSDRATAVKGLLSARGAGLGNGGTIETSGHTLDVAGIAVNASAPHGAAGTWLLDPINLTVSNVATTAAQSPSGTWTSNSGGSIVLNTDVDTALNAGTNVALQTSSTAGAGLSDLNVNAPIAWSANTSLTLTASNNVNINAGIAATGGTAGLIINPNAANGAVPASGSGVFNLNNASVTLSGANPSLSIGGAAYTVINSLGVALDATIAPATPTLQGVASANLAGHYALGSDIDAAATLSWNGNTGFTPIGTVAVPFNGTFDGLGHSIANLTINRPATADVGLFGSTSTTATIQDVGLVGGSVTGLSSAGGLVGSNTGTITHSFNTGIVSGGSSLGGLMGSNTGAVSFSYATGNVSGTSSLGGLMGSNTGTVDNSYAAGNVTGTSSLGGLMGSSTTGLVSNSYATGNVSGTSSVGGLMGSSTGPVIDTYATGAVSGTTSVGGLMGSSSGPVTDSYWNTETSGQPTSPGGSGLTSVQMRQPGNFHLWDFANTWTIYTGLTNPLLRSFMTPLTVTANNAAKTYDGLAFSGGNGVTYSSPPNGNVLGTVNYGGPSQGAVNVGGYIIAPSGLYSNQQGYIIGYGSGILTVTAAPLTVTANAQSRLYGAANPTLSYGSSGLLNGDTLSGLLATTATPTSNVGAYAITQGTLAASTNYALTYLGANLAVTTAPLTVTANAQSRLYGAANPTLSYVSSGLLNGDTLSGLLATSATTTSNVGSYAITQGTLANSNYSISYGGANLGVTAAPLTVTADAQSRLYGAANPALTYVSSGLLNGDALFGGLATTATTTSNVGAYGITQGSLANSNYAISYAGANLSVMAAPLSVTADAQSRFYGAVNPALTYVSSGLLNGDMLSGGLATTATATSNVGAYGITQGTLAATSNYALSYTGANLSVTAAPLTVTADAKSRLYGAANPALTYLSSGLVNGDTLTGGLATTATTISNVGAYGITQGSLAATSNYALSYTGANLNVTAAPLAVTANTQSRLYGAANPALTYVSSGLLNGDMLSGGLATTATTTSNVGAYGITQGSLAATSNYALSYVGANLAVTAAPLTVTADAKSRLYGTANPALTYVSSGLLNGDMLSGGLATTATTTSNVGAYGITQGSLAATSNYALSYTGANLAVTVAPLTVTANAQSRIYGSANPTLSYASSGLLNGDTLAGLLATSATTTSNVGVYGITQGNLAATSNYALSYIGANLSVTTAPLAVTANAQSRLYGAVNPALTYLSSGLLNGDTLSGGLATAATTTSNVGAYGITQGTLANSNYALSYTGANLNVTAAPLTVTANAQSRLYGAVNPALTYLSSGLLNGDMLSGGLATSAISTSNVGAYGITQGNLAASSNYALSYVGANLNVTTAPLTVTANAQSRLYGAINPALTYLSSGLVNGDALSGGLATTATTTSNVGVYGITQGNLAASSNYALSYVGANLSVTAAPLTVTANAQQPLFPSYFTPIDLVGNNDNENGFTLANLVKTPDESICTPAAVLQALNRYDRVELTGGKASCKRGSLRAR